MKYIVFLSACILGACLSSPSNHDHKISCIEMRDSVVLENGTVKYFGVVPDSCIH